MNAPVNAPIEIELAETGLAEGQILADSIRPWRSDCKAGQFKIGATIMHGNRLDMEIIGAQISEGEYFAYPLQKWLAILFVDSDRALSSILFKGESLDNFEEVRRKYRLKGETLLGKTIRAQMAMRSSRTHGETYYAVEFEVVSAGQYAQQIAEFRQQHYNPALFRQLSGPVENGGNGHATDSASAENSKGKKK
jgi:hypothetical protein